MTWKNETTRQPLPAPLPMYEPVRLKHVPTFVTRRYDKDVTKIKDPKQGLSSEEGKSDGDGVEDNDDCTIVSDVGDSVDDKEVEDDTLANFDTEHDTETNREEFGSRNIETSSSTYSGDSKIKNDKDQDAIDTSSYVDFNVEDSSRDQSWQNNANSDMNDHGSYSKDREDEDDGAKDVDFVSFADVSIENDVHDNEQGLNSIDQKYEVDGPEDVTPIGCEHDNKIDDNGTKDGIIASWYDNGSVKNEVQDDSEHVYLDKERQGLPEEDDKREGDAAAGPDLDDSVNYKAEYNAQANNLDTKHDTNADTSMSDGAQHNEHGVYVDFHEQDNNIDDGTKDGIVASCYENGSDQHRVEDDEHGNSDKEQDLLVSNCEKIEDGTVVSNFVDESFKLKEIKERQHEDLGIELDFPEAFMKTLEREGYELCCPNCKHIITGTMIFRRREDCQESRTTCFTFLTSLFCCSRW